MKPVSIPSPPRTGDVFVQKDSILVFLMKIPKRSECIVTKKWLHLYPETVSEENTLFQKTTPTLELVHIVFCIFVKS